MLKELNIKNFAIIDQLHVEFGPGLNVFTGETGAGKSIVVDALNLALGERASTDLIRSGSQEATVEAAFALNGRGSAEVRALLAAQGIESPENEDLIVRRVIAASGKNKVYINGSLANVTTLAAAGALLADIHGQHEHQSLLSLEQQLDLLDSFGGLVAEREAFADKLTALRGLRERLAALASGEREKAQREDLLRYQVNEIEAAQLKDGEDEELARERTVLANAEKLSALAQAVDEAVYSSEASALAMLRKAAGGLRDIVAIDPRLGPAFGLLESGRVEIEEAAREIAAYAEGLEFDPGRLEAVGDRIDAIQKLKKKYGATIAEINAFAAAAAAELAAIERSGEEMQRLGTEIAKLRTELTNLASVLTSKRTAAARALEKKVETELAQLGMKKTVFSVAISALPGDDTDDGRKAGPRGADRLEFLISPNPGEEPKSLAKIASGGELSRIMLALKTILVEGDSIPTLVFDEVDAGIGGAVAEEVGRKLKRIAARRQVFCITHLPQIASMATHHFGVAKSVRQERTSTEVELLSRGRRVDEIARMLGGKTITDAVIRHAEEMIVQGVAAG